MTPAVSGFISGLGPLEILVILVIALLLFGKRLPEVAKTVGRGYMEFRRTLKNLEGQIDLNEDLDHKNSRGTGPAPRALPPADQGGTVVKEEEKPVSGDDKTRG